MNFETIIFYIILIDAIVCFIASLCNGKWYTKHFRLFSRFFPLAKGWAFYYLLLTLWIGSLLYREGVLWQ